VPEGDCAVEDLSPSTTAEPPWAQERQPGAGRHRVEAPSVALSGQPEARIAQGPS